MSRPEEWLPPDLYYNSSEARKYDASSRVRNIQDDIAKRAIEMLCLPPDQPCYVLDVGCGSGLSGQVLEESGHMWVGVDISHDMLTVAKENECIGDVIHHDMGHGLPFRSGIFDGVISVSALQWLCYANKKEEEPIHRLNSFFSNLYRVMKKDARAVLQFYPENSEQAVLISQAASKVGFSGGIVVDYPNSAKAKKFYLCLSFERSYKVPEARIGDAQEGVQTIRSVAAPRRRETRTKRAPVKSVEWIKSKKDHQRKIGKSTRPDSKYTGRKRSKGF